MLRARETNPRLAVAVAVISAMLLVWINLAVGIVGTEAHPANLMYVGVLAVGFLGALLSRVQPRGMARTMGAMALCQTLVALIAIIGRLGLPASGPLELIGVNGAFVLLFLGSAGLFWRAAREQSRLRNR